MKRLLPVLVLLLIPSPAAAARPCSAPDSTTVRKNAVARVFQRGPFWEERLIGCMRSSGRRVTLAQNYDDGIYESGTWSEVKLYRRFVRWNWERVDTSCKADCPPGYGYWEYDFVRDLARGGRVGIPDGFKLGHDFVLTSTKVIGTVVRGELRTPTELIDTDVDPRSLEAHGDRMMWTKAGEKKTRSFKNQQ